jgi:8-oxo-(d)GTP phosphatase
MNLFINDTPVKFVKENEPINESFFDFVVKSNSVINLNKLSGEVLIDDVEAPQVRQMIKQLVEEPFNNSKFVIRPHNYKEAKVDFMSLFKVMKAAGGVVQKGEKSLMIHRLGKWDFPKGKLEKKESFKDAAIREVEEETGLKVALGKKVCTTWHTYTFRKKRILKCTKWYAMDCLDDSKMAPQKNENIDKVEWFNKGQVDVALSDTYNSIRFVWESYIRKNLDQ